MKTIALFVVLSIFIMSCSKTECDYSYKNIHIGLEKNVYKNSDTLYVYAGNNRSALIRQSVIQKEEKVGICGIGCQYGGACSQNYNMVTSYIDYYTINKIRNVKIANTFYASDKDGLNYDVYRYIIDDVNFILPSNYDENLDREPEIIDSVVIRDKFYNYVKKLTGDNKKSFLYVYWNDKIIRYVNTLKRDTLDFE